MKIVSVIPITRGITKEELTYYTTQKVAPGDIVTVPLRKKNVPALVTRTNDVRAKKSALRKASYSIRKITSVHTKAPLSEAFISSVATATTYFACTTGTLLNALVPKAILTQPVAQKNTKAPVEKNVHEVAAFQDDESTRLAYYKSLARESFAKKQSLLIVLPTRANAEIYFDKLNRGITEYTFLIHTGFTLKKQADVWKKILEASHSVLIVATPKFLSLPRNDIGTIVIEHEHSRHYKTSTKPYLDFRVTAEFLARAAQLRLILGDELLRLETLRRLRTHEIVSVSQPRMHYSTKIPVDIVDMSNKAEETKKAFYAVSAELRSMIASLKAPSERCFVFTLRKGLYPLTMCGDCGTLVTCPNCDAPVVVHKHRGTEKNTFMCHRCNTLRSTEEKCANCNSWNLVPLGIGSQRIELEIEKVLPDTPVFHIDADSMTPIRIQKVVKRWYDTEKSVLIGTEAVFPYINETSHIAVASLDTLFALPDFRASERMFQTFLFLRNRATRSLLIQTRNPKSSIFKHAQSGNVLAWYNEELQERKEFNYPPFTTLIKITTVDTPSALPEYIEALEEKIGDYKPDSFPAFTPRVRGKSIIHTLITLPYETWPDPKLVAILQNLSPRHTIHVDPEHLL